MCVEERYCSWGWLHVLSAVYCALAAPLGCALSRVGMLALHRTQEHVALTVGTLNVLNAGSCAPWLLGLSFAVSACPLLDLSDLSSTRVHRLYTPLQPCIGLTAACPLVETPIPGSREGAAPIKQNSRAAALEPAATLLAWRGGRARRPKHNVLERKEGYTSGSW